MLEFLRYLEQQFEITSGSLKSFLGMKINLLNDNSILINQKSYAEKLVKRFCLENANSVQIPADPNSIASIFEEEGEKIKVPYKEAIGSLLFLAMVYRPDIAFSVGVLSRFSENPTKIHWNAVKRIIKYIKWTAEYGLIYKSNNDCS